MADILFGFGMALDKMDIQTDHYHLNTKRTKQVRYSSPYCSLFSKLTRPVSGTLLLLNDCSKLNTNKILRLHKINSISDSLFQCELPI